jgi:predicted nucleic acid-binding protein
VIVVSDTSPVSNLLVIGRLDLLRAVYPAVLVPPAVHAEILALRRFSVSLTDYVRADWIRLQAPTDLAFVSTLLKRLDAGESEAIALAVEVGADTLLIDESKGRFEAAGLGLNTVGLLGVLLKAKAIGALPLVKPVLDELMTNAEFYVAAALRERVLQLAGE